MPSVPDPSTSQAPPTVAFIMSTKGRQAIFEKSIAALHRAVEGRPGASIVVVNDAKGQPVPLPEPCRGAVTLVDNLGSGYAANMNTGPKTVRADYYVFIDNDIIVDSKAVSRFYSFIAERPDACLHLNWVYPPDLLERMHTTALGRFLLRENVWNLKGWFDDVRWDDEKMFETDILPSNMLLIPRKVFEHVGGFNEAYTYLSIDDEFTKKAKTLGYKLYLEPTLSVLHNEEDRLALEPRLARFYAGGQARKQRVLQGDMEYEFRLPLRRHLLLSAISFAKAPLIRIAAAWPDWRFLDFAFFKLAGALVMVAWHDGYHGNEWLKN